MTQGRLTIAAFLCLACCGNPAPREADQASSQEVSELLRQLNTDGPAEREEATLRLTELGDSIEEPLRRELDSAQGEVRFRIEQILASPYRGLDRKTAQETAAIVKTCEEHLSALTSRGGGGRHGSHHELNEARERDLWMLLAKVPRFRGGPHLLLRAIDDVYLRYHENAYHGWIWHWPYFDCAKAVALAERLRSLYPETAEESLWTKIYCYRIQGLNAKEYSSSGEVEQYASIAAQIRWKADLDRVRALSRELLENYPRGKYAVRASEILEQKELLVTLPTSWGPQATLIDRR